MDEVGDVAPVPGAEPAQLREQFAALFDQLPSLMFAAVVFEDLREPGVVHLHAVTSVP